MDEMKDAIGLRISGGPPGFVRVETRANVLAESSVRYLERRGGAEQPANIQLDRHQDGPLFESGGVCVSLLAYKDRIEVVIAVRRDTPEAIYAT